MEDDDSPALTDDEATVFQSNHVYRSGRKSKPDSTGVKGLIGPSAEVDVLLEGVSCRALLDTGSMTSTLSETFVKRLGLTVHPIEHFVSVEGVGGHQLQYLGYSIAKLNLPDIGKQISAMFLVVPEIGYNRDVPVLIGTNILVHCLPESDGDVPVEHSYPWSSVFQCVSTRSTSLNLPVKLTKDVTIAPGCSTTVVGMIRAPVFAGRITVVSEEPDSALPGGVLVTPCVVNVKPGTSRVTIELQNASLKQVHISAKTVVSMLQQAKVVSQSHVASMEESEVPLLDQFDWPDMSSRLTESQIGAVKDLITNYESAFAKHDLDLGHTKLVQHHIELTDNQPFKLPYRRVPPSMYEEVKKHLEEMLALDAIKVSHSPYSSPVVLVRKKNGKLRFCIDLRRLNSKTKRDAYALPRVDDMFDSLSGARWFSSLDIKSAYWQVELAEGDKEKTAFSVGSLGFYECNRMPFGLTNAPATFQRLMESCLGDTNMMSCLIYLDDIVVFSSTFEEHVERLTHVFQRLMDAGLKLSPSKCFLFQSELRYLGHVISNKGVAPDPDKLECVKQWPVPTSVDEVQSFLGFVGYHRRFIKDFSKVS